MKPKTIKRTSYLSRLKAGIGTRDIKVITGIRRCGKSVLLQQFQSYLEKTYPRANIIHIDLDLPENHQLLNYDSLYAYISSQYKKSRQNFLLVDEVQLCADFEHLFNGLHAEGKYDIYVTGSNAFLLSSDLATLFTGRVFEIQVFPFSYAEFLDFHHLSSSNESFELYFKQGGMPGSFAYKDQHARESYLSTILNSLIVRDIDEKHRLGDAQLLQDISHYLMDNISNQTSSLKISNFLTSNGRKISDKTVSSYLRYLCDAFAFYEISRYDIKGKYHLAQQKKYYLADHAFRQVLIGAHKADYGRIYENIVAIELLRRGYRLSIGEMRSAEVDFIAENNQQKIYIQVSASLDSPDTYNREIKSLLSIKDAYPKVILTRTDTPLSIHDGIYICDLKHWLAGISDFHSELLQKM